MVGLAAFESAAADVAAASGYCSGPAGLEALRQRAALVGLPVVAVVVVADTKRSDAGAAT